MRVVATAGHVDHGKSTLVRALTGTDPDRLAEERERGLTIDLGFAWTSVAGGEEVAFIDVPGHARFLKNMLAGVGAVDACLFVVATTEGWKPQSEEHLRILELLGVRHGVVALTKIAGVDNEWRALVRTDLAEHVAGTFLDGAPVVEVDAPGGVGVGELAAAVDDLVGRTPPAADLGRPRLWIDRSFVARGSGTVVTGTLIGGSLHTGDELAVVPGGRRVRVRGLQALKRERDTVAPGGRVAVNLTGVSPGEAPRGHALVRAAQWRPSATVDASLTVLGGLGHVVTRRGSYAAYFGSGEHRVTLRVLDAGGKGPGAADGGGAGNQPAGRGSHVSGADDRRTIGEAACDHGSGAAGGEPGRGPGGDSGPHDGGRGGDERAPERGRGGDEPQAGRGPGGDSGPHDGGRGGDERQPERGRGGERPRRHGGTPAGDGVIRPGETGLVRLHLPVALPLVMGDRYVLREDGRGETVGGGEILDVAPVLRASRARPTMDVDRIVAERGWVDAGDLEALTGHRREPTVGRWVVSDAARAAAEAAIRDAIDRAGPLGLDVAVLDDRHRAVLATLDDVVVDLGRVRPTGAPPDPLADHPYLAALEARPYDPPDPAGVDRTELRELVRRGRVVERDGVCFAATAVDGAAAVVADLLATHPEGFTAAQARTALGTTRKYALPLLAQLDATGVTRRRGDVRVAGPRLADRARSGGGRESNPPSQGHHDHPL